MGAPERPRPLGTVVIGAGPAGTGLLRAALAAGTLPDLVARGLRVVDPGRPGRRGGGSLRDYVVRSDTRGAVFTECLADLGGAAADLDALMAAIDPDRPVPLVDAARLLDRATAELVATVRSLDPDVFVPATATAVRRDADGLVVELVGDAGSTSVRAIHVVLAAGGHPHVPVELADVRGARPSVHSDDVVRGRVGVGGLPRSPSIVVLGGSHSAFSAALTLLQLDRDHQWPDGAVTLVHRSAIRVTYDGPDQARADGYPFTCEDLCHRTGRVHRFGGLRNDSAALWRSIRDGAEARVVLRRGGLADPDVRRAVRRADLVVAATGYGPPPVPDLAGLGDGRIDDRCRVVDRAGVPVDGLFAIGLGAGHRRNEATGGEASFAGAIDGVWFYQHVIGPQVVDQLVGRG
jgi:hypothetical protein